MASDLDEKTVQDFVYGKYPEIYNKKQDISQEFTEFVKRKNVKSSEIRAHFLAFYKKANPEEVDKLYKKHITKTNTLNFFPHGLNDLFLYSEVQLKQYFRKQNDTVKHGLLLFAAKLINITDTKTIQKFAESNIEVREALHNTYQAIEDALEPNCITRVGDLLEDKQVCASILMNAAKEAKKQEIKFEPSPYIQNYECYNRKLHGEPIPYLKKYFGEFLASCNEEGIDYLYRGDIPVIDPALWGALYRDYRKEFENLTCIAGKKSKKEVFNMSERGKDKVKKISNLLRITR